VFSLPFPVLLPESLAQWSPSPLVTYLFIRSLQRRVPLQFLLPERFAARGSYWSLLLRRLIINALLQLSSTYIFYTFYIFRIIPKTHHVNKKSENAFINEQLFILASATLIETMYISKLYI
jgi:hypothetical protein